MKKIITILLALVFTLSMVMGVFAGESEGESEGAAAPAESASEEGESEEAEATEEAEIYTVTIINGMDGSVAETVELKKGDDLVIKISCAAPADMGPVAEGEEGAGVTTTSGKVSYSDITTGGPNSYPTAETATISCISEDAEVTVTPNPDEAESEFPTLTIETVPGELYPMFAEYKEYLIETLLQDSFWSGKEDTLRADLDACETPDAETIQNFTGSGDVDQAPSGVVFPLTYAAWYELNGPKDDEEFPKFAEYKEYLIETLLQDSFWSGKEDTLRADLDACETPDAETIQNFTGSGDVDQAPSGVVFPLTYDKWIEEN